MNTRERAGLAPGGEHYDREVHPIDLIEAMGMGPDFAAGCVIKYAARYKAKDGLQDLRKARWYIDWLIAHLENRKENL